MAKRYHEPMDEKKMMKKSGGMIAEDPSAPCLLPRNVIEKDFPGAPVGMSGSASDLFMGVQKQIKQDVADLKRIEKPSKY